MPRGVPRRARPARTAKPAAVPSEAAAVARPELRPSPRPEDPRARAAARAASLREHGFGADDGSDKYAIPVAEIPDGWNYEWKRHTVYGKDDPAYEVAVARGGWTPVPVDRHPSFMPKNWAGGTIERDGLVLMERPQEITEEVRARERRDAKSQILQKEAQLNGTPEGHFPRDARADTRAQITKSIEHVAIPD